MKPERRTIRELMIWVAVIACGLGTLAYAAHRKDEQMHRKYLEAVRRMEAVKAARQNAVAAPIAPAAP